MDRAQMEQVFVNLAKNARTKEHGQGIGLTLVQEILAQHRCQYWLDSQGGPTQFTIVF